MFVEILFLTEAKVYVPFVGVNSYLPSSNVSQHSDNISDLSFGLSSLCDEAEVA
jgi:hypothetical protein